MMVCFACSLFCLDMAANNQCLICVDFYPYEYLNVAEYIFPMELIENGDCHIAKLMNN